MSSEYQIETRRRSRSKTPFLRSSCDHESCEHAGEEGHVHHHHHPKKKTTIAPNVQTIIEETVPVKHRSTVTTTTTTTKTSPIKPKMSSSPIERIKQSELSLNLTSRSTSTTATTVTKKFVDNIASSTPKFNNSHMMQEYFASQFSTTGRGENHGGIGIGIGRRANEVTQNELNSQFERSQRNITGSSWKNTSSSPIVQNGDLSDHLAYKEYKQAGEYWNKTPKTDYTYSELSPHRRMLAPGVVAMPNMSRKGLKTHDERVDYMVERNVTEEEYIRRRYGSQQQQQQQQQQEQQRQHQQQQQQQREQRYIETRKFTNRLMFDSGDEMDYPNMNSYTTRRHLNVTNRKMEEQWWFMRLITIIISSMSSAWTTITGGGGGGGVSFDGEKIYRTNYYAQDSGFLGNVRHGLASVWRYAYLFIASVLYMDAWLLQSKNPESKGRKRFLLFLLCLLPLLLLCAWYLLDDAQRQYYLQRSETLLPYSLLASLKGTFLTSGALLKGFFWQIPFIFSRSKEKLMNTEPQPVHLASLPNNIELKMQKTGLTTEEYQNILNHINSYVQKLVDVKMSEQRRELLEEGQQAITPQQTELLVNVVRENLENLARERRDASGDSGIRLAAGLSDDEVELLAQRVQIYLESSGGQWSEQRRPVRLSNENLDEIKRLIAQHIEINNHQHYTLLVERIDLDALLERLLRAPQLAKFIDSRIHLAAISAREHLKSKTNNEGGSGSGSMDDGLNAANLDAQKLLIDELNSEIAFIKLQLADKSAENVDLQRSISDLKVGQDNLINRLEQYELSNDARFNSLVAEVQERIAAIHSKQFTLLNKQIKLSLIEILGFKQSAEAAGSAGSQLDDVDLRGWVRNVFVAKDYLEERLQEMNAKTNERIKDEIDRSGMIIFRDISERLKEEILLAVERKHVESTSTIKREIHAALSEEEVRKIVKSVLAIYDADKTGLADFALESAGGQILSTRCTESFHAKTAQLSLFGIPIWYPSNTPRVAISPRVQPGECWAFQGFPGYLVLKLNSLVYVTGFTLEHIPRSLSPTGKIDSAPRNFTVWGLDHENDHDPVIFGEYEYLDNDASLQYFPVQNRENIKRPYEIVELRIETNHGHLQYTCLYRFRVHGKPPAA